MKTLEGNVLNPGPHLCVCVCVCHLCRFILCRQHIHILFVWSTYKDLAYTGIQNVGHMSVKQVLTHWCLTFGPHHGYTDVGHCVCGRDLSTLWSTLPFICPRLGHVPVFRFFFYSLIIVFLSFHQFMSDFLLFSF